LQRIDEIKCVIFDFDGTLADTFTLFIKILNHLAPKYGYNQVSILEIPHLKTLNFRAILNYLKLSRYKVPFVLKAFRKEVRKELSSVALFDGVAVMLNALHVKDIKIVILSSNSKENISTVMLHHKVDFIEQYACGVSMLGKKRKLLHVMKKIQKKYAFERENFIYIGDEIRDIESSKEANVRCALVSWGYNAAISLKAQNPEYLFEDVNEMTKRLLKR